MVGFKTKQSKRYEPFSQEEFDAQLEAIKSNIFGGEWDDGTKLFFQALLKAYGQALSIPSDPKKISDDLKGTLADLAKSLKPENEFEKKRPGEQITFENDHHKYAVNQNQIDFTDKTHKFDPIDALRMAEFASLNKNMLSGGAGVDLVGNRYEKTLLLLAIEHINSQRGPDEQIKINSKGLLFGLRNGKAKRDWEAFLEQRGATLNPNNPDTDPAGDETIEVEPVEGDDPSNDPDNRRNPEEIWNELQPPGDQQNTPENNSPIDISGKAPYEATLYYLGSVAREDMENLAYPHPELDANAIKAWNDFAEANGHRVFGTDNLNPQEIILDQPADQQPASKIPPPDTGPPIFKGQPLNNNQIYIKIADHLISHANQNDGIATENIEGMIAKLNPNMEYADSYYLANEIMDRLAHDKIIIAQSKRISDTDIDSPHVQKISNPFGIDRGDLAFLREIIEQRENYEGLKKEDFKAKLKNNLVISGQINATEANTTNNNGQTPVDRVYEQLKANNIIRFKGSVISGISNLSDLPSYKALVQPFDHAKTPEGEAFHSASHQDDLGSRPNRNQEALDRHSKHPSGAPTNTLN